MKILITGGTGFIGTAAAKALREDGHEVAAFGRKIEINQAVVGATAVINLAGAPIAEKRWSEKAKKEIWDSRVNGTAALVAAVSMLPVEKRPKCLISASAVGFY